MTDQNEEKKQVSRRDVLIAGSGSLAGLILGSITGCQPEAPVADATTAAAGGDAVAVAPVELNVTPVTFIGRNLANCNGCRLCEVACSQFHEDGKIWPAASRVTVHELPPGLEFPVMCYQCGNAPCAASCPVGAISINPETSTMIYDPEVCLRTTEGADCNVCSDACPGAAIHFHPVTSLPISCDLCGGNPSCVQVCVTSNTLDLNGMRLGAALPEEIMKTLKAPYTVPGAGE